ncbi:MAG: HNH endonuclease signature motif containing protein [Campylobacterota bacterium]|nr:HNH endonuclease signature motif containing protein [Campylobacterota bacterium]
MAFLGLDFIVSSILLLCLVFIVVFIFRERLKKLVYGRSSFDLFLSKLKTYLELNYPKTSFNFDIIEKSKIEDNPTTRKYLIVDNIISQYTSLTLDSSKFPSGTPANLHWKGYAFLSEPDKNKLPKDWVQRKQALLTRDKNCCFRCGKSITISNMDIHMIRDINKGGKYFLENLLPVCKDCFKLLNNQKLNHITIKDDLYDIVKTT